MSTDEVFSQDGRLVESVQHHGDGTGTRTVYDAHGNVAEVENLTGLLIPDQPEPDPIVALQDQVAAQQETIDALLEALGGGQ